MSPWMRSRLGLLALVAAAAGGLIWAVPAAADNSVSLTIVSDGTLRTGVVDAELETVAFSDEAQVSTGTLQLYVTDRRGTAAGWSISVVSSDFFYQGESPDAKNIPSSGFRIAGVKTPEVVAGQPRVEAGPNFAPLVDASLDTPRMAIWAGPGAGSGDYVQLIDVVLDIPAQSQVGTYQAVLTVSTTNGP